MSLPDLTNAIKPFRIVHHDHQTSVILDAGSYKQAAFDTSTNKCMEGNGYDWASVAAVYLDDKAPNLKDEIQFDPEADTFSAYAENRQALEEFAVGFHAACEDDAALRSMISRATPG